MTFEDAFVAQVVLGKYERFAEGIVSHTETVGKRIGTEALIGPLSSS